MQEKTGLHLLSVRQAAAYLGVSVSFLAKARLKGNGPVYTKIGHRVLHRCTDIDAYVATQLRSSTSASGSREVA
jgi:hypothetical protein